MLEIKTFLRNYVCHTGVCKTQFTVQHKPHLTNVERQGTGPTAE